MVLISQKLSGTRLPAKIRHHRTKVKGNPESAHLMKEKARSLKLFNPRKILFFDSSE